MHYQATLDAASGDLWIRQPLRFVRFGSGGCRIGLPGSIRIIGIRARTR